MIPLLLSKERYNSYINFIDVLYLKDTNKELYYIYKALEKAHEVTKGDLDTLSLQAYFFHLFPDADKELYSALFDSLSEASVDPDLGESMLRDIKTRKTAMKLSEEAFKFSTGVGDEDAVQKALDAWRNPDELVQLEEFKFVTTSLSKILEATVQKPGLRWRLNFLNKSLGSLRKGDFGFLFARPETGKTTFLTSEISVMLKMLPEASGPIVWFNNEEQGEKVMLRMYQAYFAASLEQIMANSAKYEEQFERLTKGKFKLVDDATITRQQVERLLKQLNPSLIVFDQITKVKGFAADREDLKLGAICTWARELAKVYAPIIGVMQADGTAEGQKWLTMDHVANVKTAVQAEADWILGIGMVHMESAAFIRYLNISKNKLVGDPDTLTHLRHGRSEVLIEPSIARYKDIVNYE